MVKKTTKKKNKQKKSLVKHETTYAINIAPEDLEFVCSNEAGGFILFKSKIAGRFFYSYRSKGNNNVIYDDLDNNEFYNNAENEVVLEELGIFKQCSKKEYDKDFKQILKKEKERRGEKENPMEY